MKRHAHVNEGELQWYAACDDARYLAVELAAGRPRRVLDIVNLGFVLPHGETAFRHVPAAIRQYDDDMGRWSVAAATTVLITDRRLLLRFTAGPVVSLWWDGLVGVDLNWSSGNVVLDYGDGAPRALCGPFVADLAVAAAAGVYGVPALLTHHAFDALRPHTGRTPSPSL